MKKANQKPPGKKAEGCDLINGATVGPLIPFLQPPQGRRTTIAPPLPRLATR